MFSRYAIFVFLGALLTTLLLAVSRLKKRNRLLENFRRDFVANISHEFRTPLAVIKGYAETLSEAGVTTETVQSFLKIIQNNTERLITMVEDLLELLGNFLAYLAGRHALDKPQQTIEFV